MSDLTFRRLREVGVPRCREVWPGEKDWGPNDWLACLVGEVGELAAELRALRRLGPGLQALHSTVPGKAEECAAVLQRAAEELADVVCYADLLAARLGVDLGEVVARKFDAVSDRVGWQGPRLSGGKEGQ